MQVDWIAVADAAIITAFALVASFVGTPVVRRTFAFIERRTNARGERLSLQAPAVHLPGGRWIGVLERLAIFVCILGGWHEGAAVVLGVKSLARYPELAASATDPTGQRYAAERFIIGTFISAMFAAGCAGLAIWVTGLTH